MANNYSASLDGSTDAFSATDHADFKPTGVFTVGAWVKTSATAAAEIEIFQSYAQNTNPAGFKIYIYSGHATFLIGKNTVGGYVYIEGTTNIGNNAWHWVVGVWDGTYLKIYVDGSSDGVAVSGYAPVYQATNYVRVGCGNITGANTNFFPGNLEEGFLINGTAWDATKITAMYKKFLTGETNLKAYYPFENNGDDASGNSHTLTGIGTPTYATDVPFTGFTPKIIII